MVESLCNLIHQTITVKHLFDKRDKKKQPVSGFDLINWGHQSHEIEMKNFASRSAIRMNFQSETPF
jgi:hypothetical protein